MTIEMTRGTHVERDHHEPLPDGTQPLVLDLLYDLAATGVRYCHWKSNDMLARCLTGENDLDLLIHRADGQLFAEVLARLGFRQALAPGGREHHGVSHHYALDMTTGRFVHIHAHHLLVLGDDTTKNFRLPIEAVYLDSRRAEHVFQIPAPEFELAVYVVRLMVKHATWDSVAIGKGSISAAERRELGWLLERADPEATLDVVAEHLPGIGVELWSKSLAAVQGPEALLHRMRLGRRVIRCLRPHARRPWPQDLALRTSRRLSWGLRHYVFRIATKKQLARAGAMVAIVGGDGSGKSTAVERTAAWLSGPFEVHRTHLGKPRPSLLTLAVKGPMYVARHAGLLPGTGATIDPRTATFEDFPGRAWVVWQVLTARDRLRAYRKARRVADSGGIVVSDRWPLEQIRLMDGARTTWLLSHAERLGWLTRRLCRAEAAMYAQMAPPDVLVVLRLDPEIAVARRADEEPAFVRRRNAEVHGIDWSGTDADVLDATLPPDELLARIKTAVWERL
jgi:hypothetical protein